MFWRGVLFGLAIAATLALLYVAYDLRHAEAMYRDFGNTAQLPALTRFTFGPWRLAAPLGALAAITALGVRRPASWMPYAAAAFVIFGAAVLTWYAIELPLFALAGNITP